MIILLRYIKVVLNWINNKLERSYFDSDLEQNIVAFELRLSSVEKSVNFYFSCFRRV